MFLSEESEGLPGLASDAVGGSSLETETQVIKFALGDEQYGVDIMAVREIKEWSNVTALPEQPEYVRGVLDLRGVMVPVIDLRCRFGQGLTEPTPRHIVIIVKVADQLVGIMGDRVLDIESFKAGDIRPVPKVAADSQVSFISGLVSVDDAMIAIIDLPALLSGKAQESAPTSHPLIGVDDHPGMSPPLTQFNA